MPYTKFFIIAAICVALILWLHECTAPESADDKAQLDQLRNQAVSITQSLPSGAPSTPPAPAQKPASTN